MGRGISRLNYNQGGDTRCRLLLNKKIGMKKLAVARVAHEYGISMQEVAEKLGISRRALSSRVNENPTLSSLTQVAEVIGCDITDLFK